MNAMTDPNTYLEKFNESDKLGSLLGTRAISVSDTECVYEYETATEHFNPDGMLHGGTLFTVMDSSQRAFLHFFLDKKYECAATRTATIRFLKPVHAGRITVKRRCKNKNRVVSTSCHAPMIKLVQKSPVLKKSGSGF